MRVGDFFLRFCPVDYRASLLEMMGSGDLESHSSMLEFAWTSITSSESSSSWYPGLTLSHWRHSSFITLSTSATFMVYIANILPCLLKQ